MSIITWIHNIKKFPYSLFNSSSLERTNMSSSLSRCPVPTFLLGAAAATGLIMMGKYLFSSSRVPKDLLRLKKYSSELRTAIDCALRAGYNLRAALLKSDKAIQSKGSAIDFVTETDRYNEELIFGTLAKRFPNHRFIGEETCATGGHVPKVTTEPTWIVDPIDGTTNFVHSNPAVCVSIGFVVEGVPVIGVVYAPCTDELFVAVKGCGAFLNGQKINVSRCQRIRNAIVMTEVGYERDETSISLLCNRLRHVLSLSPHAVRQIGSGVLDLCYLACGRVDALYAEGWFPWDYCAGMLIVEEAGGTLSTFDGSPFHLEADNILGASSVDVAGELRTALAQAD